jgi:glyoxylase-like metal-dependent hydrolase (beta-lactamase superfamily II)
MIHEILQVGMLQCNCSIFGDEASKEAIVVDPGDDISDVEAVLAKHGLRCTAIVITHAHIDHVGGAKRLKDQTGAPVYLNEADQELYTHLDMQAAWLGVAAPQQTAIDVTPQDGDTLALGPATFHVMHTPGHTQGSLCLWIPEQSKLVAGDTLFRESIGRTDLPGGDSRRIILSIREKLFALPEETVVIPGHGPATTIAHERERNPFVRGT